MKKLSTSFKSIALATLIFMPSIAFAQENKVVFKEDFGTASSKKDEPIENHQWETNDKSMFTWNVADGSSINVRTNNKSDYDDASGDGNLYFKGIASFTISGIKTENYKDLKLAFGVFGKNSAATNTEALGKNTPADINFMKVTCTAIEGTPVEVADLSKLSLNQDGDVWDHLDGIALTNQSKTLTLTFTTSLDATADGGIRIDDVTITGTDISAGINETANTNDLVLINGRTITYSSDEGRALVYNAAGILTAEINAGHSVELNVPAGLYIITTGGSSIKTYIK